MWLCQSHCFSWWVYLTCSSLGEMIDIGNKEGRCVWEQVHGLTASARTKSSWQTAKWPRSFHRCHCLSLGVRGKCFQGKDIAKSHLKQSSVELAFSHFVCSLWLSVTSVAPWILWIGKSLAFPQCRWSLCSLKQVVPVNHNQFSHTKFTEGSGPWGGVSVSVTAGTFQGQMWRGALPGHGAASLFRAQAIWKGKSEPFTLSGSLTLPGGSGLSKLFLY